MRDLLDDPAFISEVNRDSKIRQSQAVNHSSFRQKLTCLINECSMEQYSDTADFILAAYLLRCLVAYEEAVRIRDKMTKGIE